MSGHLSVDEQWQIISLYYDQNISPSAIAVNINCTVRTVHNIVRFYDETDDIIERRSCNRPSLSKIKITKVLMKICRRMIDIISILIFI